MADTEVEQPEPTGDEPGKETGPQSSWARLPADSRLLVVTVAGTLIANVLTVLVVAVAVVVAKNGVTRVALSPWVLVGAGIVAAVIVVLMGDRWENPRWLHGLQRYFVIRLLMANVPFALFWGVVALLALLGKAAGLK